MDAASISVGHLVDQKYRIERHVGEGAMGKVLAARHVANNQLYALKVLSHAADDTLATRFMREAGVIRQMHSRHVPKVHGVGKLGDGSPYIVMELLEGEDLEQHLRRFRRLPLHEAVTYVLQACEALAEAHALGIVHRDVKPGNLFLTRDDSGAPVIKLLDFGISKIRQRAAEMPVMKLTAMGTVLGSPQYMPPEQLVHSSEVDGRADIWSLGVVLYELLTGKDAFNGESLPDLCAAIAREEPKPLRQWRPELPVEVERVIARCLAKDPSQRYATTPEMAKDLAPFAKPGASTAPQAPAIALDGTVMMDSGVSLPDLDAIERAMEEREKSSVPPSVPPSGLPSAPPPSGPLVPSAVPPSAAFAPQPNTDPMPRVRSTMAPWVPIAAGAVALLVIVLGLYFALRSPSESSAGVPQPQGSAAAIE